MCVTVHCYRIQDTGVQGYRIQGYRDTGIQDTGIVHSLIIVCDSLTFLRSIFILNLSFFEVQTVCDTVHIGVDGG